ncbi:hypothetical protein ACIQMJ_40165 [Actinosynnema sp. NPDC091369]
MAVLLSDVDAAWVAPMDLPSNDVTRQLYVVWGTGEVKPVALTTFDVTADTRDVRLPAWPADARDGTPLRDLA